MFKLKNSKSRACVNPHKYSVLLKCDGRINNINLDHHATREETIMSTNFEEQDQPKDGKGNWSDLAPSLSAATSGFLDKYLHTKPPTTDDLLNSLGFGNLVINHRSGQLGSAAMDQATKSPARKAAEQTAEGFAAEAHKSPAQRTVEGIVAEALKSPAQRAVEGMVAEALKSPAQRAAEASAKAVGSLATDEAAKSPLMKQTEKTGKATLAGVGEYPPVVALSTLRDMVSSTSEAIDNYRVHPLHKLTPGEMIENFFRQQQKSTESMIPPGVSITRGAAGMLHRIVLPLQKPGNYSVFPEKPPANPPEKDKWQ